MNKFQPLAVMAGSRTPFAKSFTSMSQVSAVDLGTTAVKNLLNQANLEGGAVDEVIIGNVSGPPDAANIARVISLMAGIPQDRIAHTVNRNCGSGMESIVAAWQSINEGRSELAIAGGTESMSQVPMLWSSEAQAKWLQMARAKTVRQKLSALTSFRPRHFKPVVALELGLTDPTCGLNMGQTAELLAEKFNITRAEQDQFALESHLKAEAAQQACFLSGECRAVVHVGDKTIDKDNAIRKGQSIEQLKKLRPIFKRAGSVTAGNSCPLTDGAAALLLASMNQAEKLSSKPLGYITGYAIAGCRPDHMGLGPVHATAKLLKNTGLSLEDFDLVEINEAFAAQVIACQRAFACESYAKSELGMAGAVGELRPEITNIHGGAIALGHPVGTTGTRMILTLLRSLRAAEKRRGLATLCIGGGQGLSMIVETDLEM
jgi:acetyl-CoA C-acetyltransferase/acetyl-CoA acyltransferase